MDTKLRKLKIDHTQKKGIISMTVSVTVEKFSDLVFTKKCWSRNIISTIHLKISIDKLDNYIQLLTICVSLMTAGRSVQTPIQLFAHRPSWTMSTFWWEGIGEISIASALLTKMNTTIHFQFHLTLMMIMNKIVQTG